MTGLIRKTILAMSLSLAALPAVMPTSVLASYNMDGGSIAERGVNDLSTRLGISRDAAAGIMGNYAAETGNFEHFQEIRPVVPGSRGGAGFAQWTGPRRVEFESFAAERGLSLTSYEANIEFTIHEMTGSHAEVLGRLRNAESAQDAAYIVRRYYEAPQGSGAGEHHSDPTRMGYAEAYANGDFSGSPAAGAYGGGSGYAYGGFGGSGGAAESQPSVTLMPWGSTRSIGAYPQGTT